MQTSQVGQQCLVFQAFLLPSQERRLMGYKELTPDASKPGRAAASCVSKFLYFKQQTMSVPGPECVLARHSLHNQRDNVCLLGPSPLLQAG